MRAVCSFTSILQLLGASLAAALPAALILTQHNNNADASLTLPSKTTLSLFDPTLSDGLGVPAPVPYAMLQGRLWLKFYNYGVALPPVPTRQLVETTIARIVHEHGADSEQKLEKEKIYSAEVAAEHRTLWFSVDPEEEMTWAMFVTAAHGVEKFLKTWDNTELSIDVRKIDGGEKVGMVFLTWFDGRR